MQLVAVLTCDWSAQALYNYGVLLLESLDEADRAREVLQKVREERCCKRCLPPLAAPRASVSGVCVLLRFAASPCCSMPASRPNLWQAVDGDGNFCAGLVCLAKAMMHGQVADYIGCYRMLKRCLDVDPCHVEGLCTFAVFLADVVGERTEALETYDRALQLDPSHFAALIGKAGLLAENCAEDPEADRSQVSRLYAELERRFPESAEARVGLGCFERRVLGAAQHAKLSFERALARDPSNLQALFNLGSMAHDEGDAETALQVGLVWLVSLVSLASLHAVCMPPPLCILGRR